MAGMVLIYFIKTTILKKKAILAILKINKKKGNKPNFSLLSNIRQQYIYTEADLGEGLLDEGIEVPYKTPKRENKFQIRSSVADAMDMPLYRTRSMEVPNVDEDFSYVYYCC